MSHLGIEYGNYMNRPLQDRLNMEQIVDLSERFVSDEYLALDAPPQQTDTFSKLKSQYESQKQGKHNYTSKNGALLLDILGHAKSPRRGRDEAMVPGDLGGDRHSLKGGINTSRSLRIVQNMSASVHRPQTYARQLRRENQDRIIEVVGGFADFDAAGLVHFQVQGQSQLRKEVNELANLQPKIFDPSALHRNEMTMEEEEVV